MRIRLTVEKVCGRVKSRLLASRLERLAEELGPGSFRTPEFLDTEMKLALALGRLAEVGYETGDVHAAERAFERAEQIYTALRRFLPHAELHPNERRALELGMERLGVAMERLAGRATAA
jgi:hypothetical protein